MIPKVEEAERRGIDKGQREGERVKKAGNRSVKGTCPKCAPGCHFAPLLKDINRDAFCLEKVSAGMPAVAVIVSVSNTFVSPSNFPPAENTTELAARTTLFNYCESFLEGAKRLASKQQHSRI